MAGKFKYYSISTVFILFSSLFWWKDVADLVRQEIFQVKKPNLVKKCGFIKKLCYFKSKTTLYHKIKHVKHTKWNDFL